MTEQETIRKARERMEKSFRFHMSRIEELRVRLGNLQKNCKHPRAKDERCPDCGKALKKVEKEEAAVA